MKAITIQRYGSPDVLRLREVDAPSVGDDDVLVRVRAASVNPYDWHFLTGRPYIGRVRFGLLRPSVSGLGADLAGQVEAVGRNVTQFTPGNEVFGEVDGEVPGQPMLDLGSFAEYVCVSERSVAPKPRNLTFEQAAAVPMAGLTALQALRDRGRIRAGQKVLINGASGGVGTFAVQIAKSLGAEVTGVCSGRNLDLVQSLGANRAIDYTREDFAQCEQRFDLILDNVGNRSLSEYRRVLKPQGVYLSSFGRPGTRWLGPFGHLTRMYLVSPWVSQELAELTVRRTREVLVDLKDLVESGDVTPVIDRVYPLSQVPDALLYLERGRARGKVVIAIPGGNQPD
jgi:NADPH:quinone reductase-like Zn-dependent oxidoreductase